MKCLKRYLNNLKLTYKFVLLSTTALLFTSIIGMCIISYVSSLYHQELYSRTSTSMAYLVSDLENHLKSVATATDYLLDNDEIQTALTIYAQSSDTGEKARNKRKIYDNLYSYFNTSTYITSIALLLPDGTLLRMGYTDLDFTDECFSHLEEMSDEAGGKLLWSAGETYHNSVICVRQIRQKEYLKLNKLATLFVEVDMEEIVEKAMRHPNTEFRQTMLLLDTREDIFCYPYPFPFSPEELDRNNDNGYQILRLDNEKWFITSGNLPYTGWKYYHFSNYDALFNQVNIAVSICIVLLIITTVIVILCESSIINRLIFHFNLLEKKMRHFESGCPEPLSVGYDYTERNDEIGMMHKRFDETMLNYKKLVHDNYTAQLLIKDATIRNLVQQINPHFLYNVLDSIYLMAEVNHVPDIANMSHALAKLFRASVSENSFTIPLHQELDYLNSYIQIQLIRFKDQINFTLLCDNNCMDILIPKLSIQPLVENAIKHGIEETGEPCDIVLNIHSLDSGTYIAISNTGSHFPEDMNLRMSYSSVQEQDTSQYHGIGLKNINERLQLIYGKECSLAFSHIKGYAVVSFIIPKGDYPNV